MVKAHPQSGRQQPSTGETAIRVRKNGVQQQQQHPPTEQVEIQMYLSKLKELVPDMPKNRKVSKLEVIQHVIDYICDLQTTLETHPRPRHSVHPHSTSAAVASVAGMASIVAAGHRQPLGLLTTLPNTLANNHTQFEVHPSDKSLSDCDVRSATC